MPEDFDAEGTEELKRWRLCMEPDYEIRKADEPSKLVSIKMQEKR